MNIGPAASDCDTQREREGETAAVMDVENRNASLTGCVCGDHATCRALHGSCVKNECAIINLYTAAELGTH